MTLKKINEELGFSPSQWNNYELGTSFPKFLDLIKISKYFEVSETELIHTDLATKQPGTTQTTAQYEEIIELQRKIIKMQDLKINDIENKLNKVIQQSQDTLKNK